MNYEARIAALKAKGVLDANDADILEKSLQQKVAALPKRHSYSLEIVGLLLLGVVGFYFAMQVGMMENDGSIEDVSRTLNNVRVGVSTTHTFLLLVLGFGTAAFLGLYALVHRCYNKLWHIQEQMTAAGMLIADLGVRREEIHERLQAFLSQSKNGKKSTRTAIQITEELDRVLGELQQRYAALQAECRHKQGAFPCTLATMAGTLPPCQYHRTNK